MSAREIQGHLKELHHTEVSPALSSAVTDEAAEDARQWQGRPLDAVYPILYLDCIHVKVRDSGTVGAKAVHLALGVTMSGVKELLGMWIPPNEGAKFWLSVVTELRNRGRTSSSPAWTVSKDFQRPLKACFRRHRFSCVSCTWCETA